MVQEAKFNLVSSPALWLEGAMPYLYIPDKVTQAKPGCRKVLVRGNHCILEKKQRFFFFKSSKARTWGFYLMTSVCKKQNDFGYCRSSNPLVNFRNCQYDIKIPALLHKGLSVATRGSPARMSEYIRVPAQFIAENRLCVVRYFKPGILKVCF